jgi:hypothetical protein
MVCEATGEVVAQVDQAIVESSGPEVTMTMVEKPASKAAGASTRQNTALVVVSTPLPTSSLADHTSSS